MDHRDPVAEWRARWQAGAPAVYAPQNAPKRQSLWQIALASFAGTVVALIGCVVLAVGGIIALASQVEDDAAAREQLTYRNDTAHEVWIYECFDRCEELSDWFPMEPDEEISFDLEWYWSGRIDWVVVVNEDTTYGCIEVPEWTGQMITVSSSGKCPSDIHSPAAEHM